MSHNDTKFSLSGIRHPGYLFDSLNWQRYRDIYEGGIYFRDRYLQKFSSDETDTAFLRRKSISPIPSFAKQAITEIRNSIFQRLPDVTRMGGSPEYSESMLKSVDRKGTSMNQFVGINILTELLVIGRVGVYIDAPSVLPTTLAERKQNPYLYCYPVEDVLSWVAETEENQGQFKAVLLRDRELTYNSHLGNIALPDGREERYRLVYRDDFGDVRVKIFTDEEEVVPLPNADADGSVRLNLPYVPFLMPDIGDSLLKDVWSYQVALLNIMSGAVSFDVSSNVPFLTIQTDLRTAGSHLKKPSATPGPEANNQEAKSQEENIGSTRGRYYDKDVDRPMFIAPPSEPLIASMQLQESMRDDIRRLVSLAVEGKSGSRTESGTAKKISAQSLEAGLSFIGTVLQTTEQQIAEIWGHYESVTSPKVAQINYPSTYSIKTDEERLTEAQSMLDIIDRTPSKMAKRTMYKKVLTILLEDQVNSVLMDAILREVDNAKYTRTDLDFIIECRKEGLVSDETASEALGFAPDEVEKAADDHADRLERILASQTKNQAPGAAPGTQNPASRGVSELDHNTDSAKEEQAAGREGAA